MRAAIRARKVVIACVLGTSLEWYDFFLYGTAAALVFGPLFFPAADPATGTLLSFATFGVGFVARPIGAVLFGHFGDQVGRRNVLGVTLLVMGLATFLIGLLPTYATMGLAAPILLGVLRFVQGISLGGQWGGAVLMLAEHGPPGRRGLYASLAQAGVPAGNLLSAALFGAAGLLPGDAFLTWGWRVPFLLSGLLALVGVWVLTDVAESPLFAAVPDRARLPLVEVLVTHPRALISAFCARVGVDVAYYVFTLYVLSYLAGVPGSPTGVALNALLVASAVQLALIPLFGSLSDRFGRRRVYLAGIAAAALWIFAFFPLLDTAATPAIMLAVIVALIAHAAMYGPQAAFIAERFSTRLRYSGASLGYQAAGVVGGGLAPIVSIFLLDVSGTTTVVSLYVLLALAVSAAGLALAPKPVPWTAVSAPAPAGA